MSRHAMVEVTCQWEECGIKFMARKQRVDKGQSRFCSREHHRAWLKSIGPQRKNIGKENAVVHHDKTKDAYVAYWYEPETMQYKSEPWARWWWELNKGEIPSGHYASYRDGNSKNNKPENVCLKTMAEISDIGERNRGVPKSEETKKKLSIAHTGKVLSDEHKANIGKAVSKMWENGTFDSPATREAYSRQGKATKGSKRTEEQKKRMSESRKGTDVSRLHTPEAIAKRVTKLIGKPQSEEANKKRSLSQKGKVFTEEHRLNLSKSLKGVYTGELASGYKDGKSIPEYPTDFSHYIKAFIRRRDEYMCQSCGEDVRDKRKGQVHHMDNIKEHTYEENLILLCVPCHQAVHGKKNITNEMIEYLKTRLLR